MRRRFVIATPAFVIAARILWANLSWGGRVITVMHGLTLHHCNGWAPVLLSSVDAQRSGLLHELLVAEARVQLGSAGSPVACGAVARRSRIALIASIMMMMRMIIIIVTLTHIQTTTASTMMTMIATPRTTATTTIMTVARMIMILQ